MEGGHIVDEPQQREEVRGRREEEELWLPRSGIMTAAVSNELRLP
jgi:hypothetical protein